jgi:hypothetical protein
VLVACVCVTTPGSIGKYGPLLVSFVEFETPSQYKLKNVLLDTVVRNIDEPSVVLVGGLPRDGRVRPQSRLGFLHGIVKKFSYSARIS